MDETRGEDSVMAFDTLFTTNQIQIMKTVLPYLDEALQKQFAVIIKYMELKYTIAYLKKHSMSLGGRHTEKKDLDIQELFPRIQGFLSPAERSRTEQIMNMINTMQTVSQFQEMMQFMNASDSGSDADTDSGSGSDASDLLMNMLSPEQRAMFEMFQNS